TDSCAIKEAEHCRIEHMPADRRVIKIMSQACNELRSCRNWRNLDERDKAACDQFPKNADVQFYRRNTAIPSGLSFHEQSLDFAKQIVANASELLAAILDDMNKRLSWIR